jgi:DNA polymerase-3 subunit gamma/tau
VLDQLLGGAGPDGVTHQLATGLLGYTPDSLLDEVVDAFAAGDGAGVFRVVDKVIETGQDPRRFTEDLLRRLRDLVIVAAVPDAPATGLIDVTPDAGERLVAQAARFGPPELSRAADLVAAGLTEMRGATAPRLLLELICARVLLPGADDSREGVLARLDRLERRIAISGGTPTPTAPARKAESAPAAPAPAPVQEIAPVEVATAPEPEAPAAPASEAPAPSVASAPGTLTLADVRRLWPDIIEQTKGMRRLTWMLLTNNAQVSGLDGDVLTLGFDNAGARDSFEKSGSLEIVRQAAIDVVGTDWKVEAIVDPGAKAEAPPPPKAEPEPKPAAPSPEATAAREAIQQTRTTEAAPDEAERPDPDADARHDDLDAEDAGLAGAELIQRELGGTIINEIRHD